MSKSKELFSLCLNQDLNVSLSWQKMTDWTVEIYTGYIKSYRSVFYVQGITKKEVLKKAIKFMKTFDRIAWQKDPTKQININEAVKEAIKNIDIEDRGMES